MTSLPTAACLRAASLRPKAPRHEEDHRNGPRRHERLAPVYAMFPDLARQRTLLAGRLSGGPMVEAFESFASSFS